MSDYARIDKGRRRVPIGSLVRDAKHGHDLIDNLYLFFSRFLRFTVAALLIGFTPPRAALGNVATVSPSPFPYIFLIVFFC